MRQIFRVLPGGYLPLYHGTRLRENDPLGSYAAATADEVLTLREKGIDTDYIYFAAPKSGEEIAAVIGKCRLVANDRRELLEINAAALAHNRPGYLETVGLRVIPTAYDDGLQEGIPEALLPSLAGEIKKMAGISVGGCFVQAALGEISGTGLADYFHESYQVVKRITTLLPCGMPYFCLCGLLDALEREQTDRPDTMDAVLRAADMVGMQNQTAFYARLLAD